MKIVTVTQHNQDLIKAIVDKAGHVVVCHSDQTGHLITMLIQHMPHICFYEEPEQKDETFVKAITLFPATRFVSLGYARGDNWTKTIRNALRQGPVTSSWRPTEPDRRIKVADLRYLSLSTPKQARYLVPSSFFESETEVESKRLFWMMHTARQVAERAEAYRDALFLIDGGENREICYRVLDGSYESVAWTRDQLARYIGYLGHFVPSADLDCMVPPAPNPAVIRFVHYDSPIELRYALFCLAMFGINEDIERPLFEMALWRYEGGTTEALTGTALVTAGLLFALKQIVMAHAMAIGWLTDPDTIHRLDWDMPRCLRRSLQSFRHFWRFHRMLDPTNPKNLLPFLERFHSIPTQEPVPHSLRIPSFAVYHNATNNNQPNESSSN